MKTPITTLVVSALASLMLLLTGCGGGGSSTKMDTADLEKSFASADATLKGPADEAVKALKGGKYFDGATALANLAKSVDKLNDEQKNAMINVGATIQLIMSEDGDRADLKVYQAVDDMINLLNGEALKQVGTDPDRSKPAPPPAE